MAKKGDPELLNDRDDKTVPYMSSGYLRLDKCPWTYIRENIPQNSLKKVIWCITFAISPDWAWLLGLCSSASFIRVALGKFVNL
jgi:hypothetical protein